MDRPSLLERRALALLLALVALFYWRFVFFGDRFTYLEKPDAAAQVLPWLNMQARAWQAGEFPPPPSRRQRADPPPQLLRLRLGRGVRDISSDLSQSLSQRARPAVRRGAARGHSLPRGAGEPRHDGDQTRQALRGSGGRWRAARQLRNRAQPRRGGAVSCSGRG